MVSFRHNQEPLSYQCINPPKQSSHTSPCPGISIVKMFDLFSFGKIDPSWNYPGL